MPKKPKKAKPPKTAVKDATHLRLRVRDELLATLQDAADTNERTLTNEITRRLEESFEKEVRLGDMVDILRLAAGEFDLGKHQASKYAPEQHRKAEAAARVLSTLVQYIWPECRSVTVSSGNVEFMAIPGHSKIKEPQS
jgi:hypothetical protein